MTAVSIPPTLRSGQLNRTIHKDFRRICELISLNESLKRYRIFYIIFFIWIINYKNEYLNQEMCYTITENIYIIHVFLFF